MGDRITVTVNGEVILDGASGRPAKARQWPPTAGKTTPTRGPQEPSRTLQRLGDTSDCSGHGPGIKFRNIRESGAARGEEFKNKL